MEQMDYMTFLIQKQQSVRPEGINRIRLPDRMFDFQRHLTEWALTQGRSAIFADCGMGKSLMLMSWAENVVRETNKPVLVVTPLAVTAQIIREAEKFGIEAHRSNDGKPSGDITVTNYEKLNKFDWKDYTGVVCDESSRIKCADAATRQLVTAFTRKVPYRLLCTATAAPNDYIELGTSSEALGYLGFMDMLNRFFKNDNNNSGMKKHFGEMPKWRFRGHSELPFWRWVCSWARALRKPSDLGFSDDGFILPALCEREHLVRANNKREGFLFEIPARDLREQREEAKRTIRERCERVAELVAHNQPAFVLCHLNDEGDLLEKIIPDAVQVSGSDSDERKEERLLGFADGKIRVLITKPKIGAHGLNFQHCNQVVFFPSHCYDEKTEALTKRGWLKFSDIKLSDCLGTVNQESLEFEWQNPTQVINEPYCGPMLEFNGQRNFDLLVTPNHNMFIQRCPTRHRSDGKWGLMPAHQIVDRFRRQEFRMMSAAHAADGERPEYVEIPLNGKRYYRSRTLKPIQIEDFMMLAGWYLTEGHARPVPGDHAGQMTISQTEKNPENRKEIIELIGRIGLPAYTKTKDIRFSNVDLAAFLIDQFGSGSHVKRIPRWVKDLHSDLLIILRDTMIKGDGSESKTYYKSFSRQLRDDFQEICIKTGVRASVHNDYVSLAWKNTRPSVHNKPTEIHYEGMIGCATVPNHTLVVRRNGIPVVSGNSYEQYYQGVRRCWRFGQKRPVTVDIVLTEGERKVMLNLQRKAKDADRMFDNLVAEMNHAVGIERVDKMTHGMEVPFWLS